MEAAAWAGMLRNGGGENARKRGEMGRDGVKKRDRERKKERKRERERERK